MKYRLGLKPVTAQPRVMLARYLTSDLPSVGDLKFPLGHPDAIQPMMLLNNELGDCAIAGSIEEVRLANALRGVTVNFDDPTALKNYELIAGYSPDDPDSDQGTDVHDLYQYRQSTGIVDADGNYHRIAGYAGLTPGDFDELLVGLSLFDMVGIGIEVPDYCEAQFDAGQAWDVVPGRHGIEGGHYIPVIGAADADTAQVFTWGAEQGITRAFYEEFNVVAVVALTEELFENGETPEGLDVAKLQRDLAELNTGRVTAKAPQ